jgi:hypothetical protein
MLKNKLHIDNITMDNIDMFTYDFELTKGGWLHKTMQSLLQENSLHNTTPIMKLRTSKFIV